MPLSSPRRNSKPAMQVVIRAPITFEGCGLTVCRLFGQIIIIVIVFGAANIRVAETVILRETGFKISSNTQALSARQLDLERQDQHEGCQSAETPMLLGCLGLTPQPPSLSLKSTNVLIKLYGTGCMVFRTQESSKTTTGVTVHGNVSIIAARIGFADCQNRETNGAAAAAGFVGASSSKN